jgi:hypothetical protein
MEPEPESSFFGVLCKASSNRDDADNLSALMAGATTVAMVGRLAVVSKTDLLLWMRPSTVA